MREKINLNCFKVIPEIIKKVYLVVKNIMKNHFLLGFFSFDIVFEVKANMVFKVKTNSTNTKII